MLITIDASSTQVNAAATVAQHMQGNSISNDNGNDNVTIISGSNYAWIFRYVFGNDNVFDNYRDPRRIHTEKVILLVDGFYYNYVNPKNQENKKVQRLQTIYEDIDTIATFGKKHRLSNDYDFKKYPYASMKLVQGGDYIDVRANY
jgi:hypothetical protein